MGQFGTGPEVAAPPGRGEPLTRSSGRPSRLAVAALLAFLLSLPAVTTRIYASDEIQYFAFLRSAWFDADLSFDNEYRYFHDRGIGTAHGFRETFLEQTTATGLRVNFGTVGCAILWAPFYLAADAAVILAGAAGIDVSRDGYSLPYVAGVCYGSAFYGFLALVIAVASASRVVSEAAGGSRPQTRNAILAAVIVAVATPLVFYMYVAPVMAHSCSAFAVALFTFVWLKVRRSWSARGFVALGAAGALMAMVREQDVFFAVGPALDFAVTLVARSRASGGGGSPRTMPVAVGAGRLLFNALAGAASFAVVYVPQALAYVTLNGRLGPSDLVNRKMRWTSPHALQVVLSPEHGLLFWTPVTALAVAGLAWVAWSAARRLQPPGAGMVPWCLAAMVAGQVYIAGSVESWTVAGAFGQRRFVGMTVLLVIGTAFVLSRVRTAAARRLVALALVLCTWWNVALMIQFGTGLMDRQRLTLRSNAWNAFVVVPRELPRIVYRYFFDRSSFYESRFPGR